MKTILPAPLSARIPLRVLALSVCAAFVVAACVTPKGSSVSPVPDRTPPPKAEISPEQKAEAQELYTKGQALIEQGNTEAAVATLGEIGNRYGDNIEPALRKQVVDSLFEQAESLIRKRNFAGAIPIYKEIEQQHGDNPLWGIKALLALGELQNQMRNPKGAAAAFDRLDQRFGVEREPAIRIKVLEALLKKGDALTQQKDIKGAIAVYDEIDRRYADERELVFRQRVVAALLSKGTLLDRFGTGADPNAPPDAAAAVAVFGDIVQRFGRNNDPAIRNAIGVALLKKSEVLRRTGDSQGSIAVYDEIVDHFGRDDSPGARVLSAEALFRKAQSLGRQDGNAATTLYGEIIRRFGSDTDSRVKGIVARAAAAAAAPMPTAPIPMPMPGETRPTQNN
jgi:TolA-binding protein